MSRSMRACVESCGPVSVIACSADERPRFEDRACLGRGPLADAVSSTKRLVKLLAASMLVMAAAPAAGLAGFTSGLEPKPSTNHSKQSSVHVARAGAVVLALDSGFSRHRDALRVGVLQLQLARAGYPPGPIDGRYGPRTEQAVTRFQAARGLLADGIAGPVTLAALSRSRAVLYPGAGYRGAPRRRCTCAAASAGARGVPTGADRWSLRAAHRAGRDPLPGRLRSTGRRDRRSADSSRAWLASVSRTRRLVPQVQRTRVGKPVAMRVADTCTGGVIRPPDALPPAGRWSRQRAHRAHPHSCWWSCWSRWSLSGSARDGSRTGVTTSNTPKRNGATEVRRLAPDPVDRNLHRTPTTHHYLQERDHNINPPNRARSHSPTNTRGGVLPTGRSARRSLWSVQPRRLPRRTRRRDRSAERVRAGRATRRRRDDGEGPRGRG